MMRFHAISDTVKKGGGGKKSSTAAKGRKPRKPKADDWEYATNPNWDPF